jgi:hypothetical protein
MKCVCRAKGAVFSGVPGILAGPPDKQQRRVVERCDSCQRFASDESAGLSYAKLKGGGSRYDDHGRVIWCPT